MTASPAPLSEAEAAVAKALANYFNSVNYGSYRTVRPEEFAGEARTAVAAARPLIAKELHASAELVYQFAQSRPVTSAEARAIFDGIAASLSLPASKETPDAR